MDDLNFELLLVVFKGRGVPLARVLQRLLDLSKSLVLAVDYLSEDVHCIGQVKDLFLNHFSEGVDLVRRIIITKLLMILLNRLLEIIQSIIPREVCQNHLLL